ncbi:MAG: serine/threonine protein kinase [Polyangiaceae bacterium]|nr:serine/threonine protein kinase [Polyangiaceae bacterium]
MSLSGPPSTTDPFLGASLRSDVHAEVSYRIERKLGVGGTAAAYFALRESPVGASPVVVKIILPRVVLEAGETADRVVQKEAVALGRLNERVPPTAFVVRLIDTGRLDHVHASRQLALPWLAVEYVHGGLEGTTLEDRVAYSVRTTQFAFEPERVSRCLTHVAEGLTDIHEVGVIHRDITPNNVLCCGFDDHEVFKISDFGIARPLGVGNTFGEVMLGTPGYIAPEQAFAGDGVGVGPWSDIFSFAVVTYFVLTGQQYFEVSNPVQALMAVRAEKRRTLLETRTLCPELRESPPACAAIDDALARATSIDPKRRPATAKAFAASVLPWLAGHRPGGPSRRHLRSFMQLQVADATPGWTWTVRHPPGDGRVIASVGWDGDGQCLALTSHGLEHWNGTTWTPAPAGDLPVANGARFVRRIASGRWLVGSDRATLAEYSRSGVSRVLRGPDESVSFVDASGDLGDLAVVVAMGPGRPPLLYGLVGTRWLKPLPLPGVACVAGVARLDDSRWLVVGRREDGRGYVALYAPLEWHVQPLEPPPGRPVVACAGRPERGIALAVGAGGYVLRATATGVTHPTIEGSPALASAALDVLDREWVGGAGELWMGTAQGTRWARVWRDPRWTAPFVSILADVASTTAMTADGGVLECRASQSQIGAGAAPGDTARRGRA